MPVSSRLRRLQDAAVDCQSVTFPGAAGQITLIRRLAFQVAGEFRRMVTIEARGQDVTVAFTLSAA